MAVPYTFGTATASIPLSNLDSNFATTITLGNTAIQLGNTVTTLNNMTLANVTVSSGNVTFTNVSATLANVTTANITTEVVGTSTITTAGITTANIATANITSAFVSGNLAFTSTGNRITGDFSNATQTNRVSFQTSTVNGNTSIAAIPNGTSTSTNYVAFTTADPTNSSFIRIRADGTGATTYLESGSIGSGTNLPMTFYTGGSESVRINTSGNVGIGTTSPSQKLTLASGYVQSGNGGAGAGGFWCPYGGDASSRSWRMRNDILAFGDFGFEQSTTQTGTTFATKLLIGNTGIVTMPAYGVGTATFSAAGVISSVSDETWKIKDGVPVDPDSMLNKLEPGYWYYNDEKKNTFGTDRQLGFYAQNVNAAIGPEAAPVPEEGKPWGYYDRSVLAVTVMSLQKALATIESLTARIAALEAK